ncbi:potassium voltage-gated channel protein Shaker-like, partial [Actinia tenebrosa]|uniref:Potassium voltage-gated channel protein Shaker-like n=1 Tax=Actinia tenebrosa TaxID=6105 RepID=A0A6P8HEK8_ACTTE
RKARKEERKMADRITLNVSGAVFEVNVEVLQRFPQTLLGSRCKRTKYYDSARNQYFFDRHRQAFEAILFYYQSNGRILCPDNVPDKVFAEEMAFFQISTKHQDVRTDSAEKFEAFMMNQRAPSRLSHHWQRKLWEFCEIPESNLFARFVSIFSQIIIYLSIAATCLETIDTLRMYGGYPETEPDSSPLIEENSKTQVFPRNVWFSFDIACFGWFTLECAIRFLAFPNKLEYFETLANCIDVLTVIIFYIFLIVRVTAPKAVLPLRILRFLTIIRIFKLFRYSKRMKIFVLTLASGIRELCMLLVFCVMILILSSSAVYYAEDGLDNSQFYSIPDAFWWSIITITTIGYGDKVPISPSGKFIGGMCAVFGALIIALPLFRFAAHFRSRLDHLSNKNKIQSYKAPNKKKLMEGFGRM